MKALDYFGRKAWDFDRFGLSPRKLHLRLNAGATSQLPVFITSVPKSGTHVLERVFCLQQQYYRPLIRTLNEVNIVEYGGWEKVLSDARQGAVYVTHGYFDDVVERVTNKVGFAKYLMVRDPRAMVLSFAHHVTDEAHPKHGFVKGLSLSERIDFAIKARVFPGEETYLDTINKFLDWRDAKNLFVSRFEVLTAAPEIARPMVTSILRHAGLDPTVEQIDWTCGAIKSRKSPTFRKGTTNEWEQKLTPSQVRAVEKGCGEFMASFGYGRQGVVSDA